MLGQYLLNDGSGSCGQTGVLSALLGRPLASLLLAARAILPASSHEARTAHFFTRGIIPATLQGEKRMLGS